MLSAPCCSPALQGQFVGSLTFGKQAEVVKTKVETHVHFAAYQVQQGVLSFEDLSAI